VATNEEVDITIRTIGDTSGAQEVSNALNQTQQAVNQTQQQISGVQDALNNALRQAMQNMPQTLEAYRSQVQAIKAQLGAPPTLPPETFGITGTAAEPPAGGQPSLAFATLMSAQQRGLAGAVDPVQQRLDAAREQQTEWYARLNAAAEREFAAEQRATAAEEARAQRIEAGFQRQVTRQGTTEQLAPEDDPQRQAQLYQLRSNQERQFQQLIRERARAIGPGGAIPGIEQASPQAIAALRAAADDTKELGHQAGVSTLSMLRFGGALAGVGIGFSLYRAAGTLLHEFFAALIDDSIKAQQAMRDNSIVLGQNATAFQGWASTVSQQAGVAQTAMLEAGTAAQQFGRNLGFGPTQTQGLDAMAVLLSRIKGIDLPQTMNLLTAALGGSAQAAQALNLQLDAGYIAFNELGGATAEVFNQLGPAEQATLRYQAALQQMGNEAGVTAPALDKLREAQGKLSGEWDNFVTTVGPGVLTGLGNMLGAVNSLATAFGNLNAQTLEHNKLSGMSDENFQHEQDLLNQLVARMNTAYPDIGKPIQDALAAGQDLLANNDRAMRDRQAGLARDVFSGDYIDLQTGAIVDQTEAEQRLVQVDQQLADIRTGPMQAAEQQAAQYAAQEQDYLAARQQTVEQIAAGGQVLAQALANEVAANRTLVDYKSEQLSLTADEARIRLQMLPTNERLVELLNEASQAQLRMQEQGLPATRALQDMNLQMQRLQAIAGNPFADWEARMQAVQQLAELQYRRPGLEQAGVEAQIAEVPYARNVEDIQRAQRELALQQAQALQPEEYQKQQIDLLSQVATAAKDAASRTYELTIQSLQVIMGGGFGALTDTDYQNIAGIAGQAVADAIHAAVQSVNTRGARPTLTGATA
jgi:hypothetical protein